MLLYNAVRILGLSMLSFIVALAVTPLVLRLLKRYAFKKQIRTSDNAPIYSKLHQNKEGTPTMGGVIIWGVTLGIALIFWLLHVFFDGTFSTLNFISRSETYLPIAAMLIAGLIGLFDDVMGVLKIGPNGGGLKVRHKLLIYLCLALIG